MLSLCGVMEPSCPKINRYEWVYDELLTFLNNPYFQVPVLNFFDQNCLIFGIDDFHNQIVASDEKIKVHSEYRYLVSSLIDAFRQDISLSHQDVVDTMKKIDATPDLKQVFQDVVEQILATEDLKIFAHIMSRQNASLQKQALESILKETGRLPDSLLPCEKSSNGSHHLAISPQPQAETTCVEVQQDSKKAISHVAIVKAQKMHLEDTTKMKTVAEQLDKSKQIHEVQLHMAIQNVNIGEESDRIFGKPVVGGSPNFSNPVQTNDMSAEEKVVGKVSEADIERRQNFLKQQRDKLIANKREQRMRQLKDEEEQSARDRPVSATTARGVLKTHSAVTENKIHEDDKTLQMRRAIAAKLRSEVVIDKNINN